MPCWTIQQLHILCSSTSSSQYPAKVFGFSEFRTGQLEAIFPALHGRDTFVRMATGSGKSMYMFMVPLVQSDTAMGIVISPLNSLMDEHLS